MRKYPDSDGQIRHKVQIYSIEHNDRSGHLNIPEPETERGAACVWQARPAGHRLHGKTPIKYRPSETEIGFWVPATAGAEDRDSSELPIRRASRTPLSIRMDQLLNDPAILCSIQHPRSWGALNCENWPLVQGCWIGGLRLGKNCA
jgi:hypothetical protein